ncbi:DHH family phosphoesterase [Companilactobacillus sp. RD055328]|uniref:DHH family phosphoesterase n=1 Tax=Companilactobacillus sp. RD055328 TaxID=2916634 RepID=UPI001FC7D55B|nr:DHH family phosphoesterase [Companilactobacillus sp. RD055328]GKQ43400.1 DHH family phosphoesterase [Companilactobacillus sp. RD055328]
MNKFLEKHNLNLLRNSPSLLWSVIIIFSITVISAVIGLFVNNLIGVILSAISFLMAFVSVYFYYLMEKSIKHIASDISYRLSRGEQEAVVNMPLGIALYDNYGKIQWVNPRFQSFFADQDLIDVKLKDLSADLGEMTSSEDFGDVVEISINDEGYQAFVNSELKAVYLYSISKYNKIAKNFEATRISIGQIFIDNYDEVTQNMSDRTRSNLNNFVTNQLTNWSNKYNFYLKRLSADRYFFISYMKDLKAVEDNGFSILDTIREETLKQNSPLTLSVGISYGTDDLIDLARQAQSNLDLALGRGGDQVVIKSEDDKARFFGGKSNPLEKRTRVRARMISQALQEVLINSDKVFVMGHQRSDMDSFGASLGIRKIAEMNGKECSIVFNESNIHTDVKRLREELREDKEIDKSIISIEQANEQFDDNSLLILVDHSKQSMSINPDLIDKANGRIVLVDHHRRGEEFPANMMLAYIEPYASSTCELVTEMLEYQPKENTKISKIEATAMLAGITVDTKSFSLRTGTRTFDAASYLRSIGASELKVQELLKENIDDFIKKNKLIESVEMFNDKVAICVADDDIYDSVIVAQAADTLLSLSDIEASFVVARRSDKVVGISARSLGSINVQVTMEKMGGGGHLSNAATQIESVNTKEVAEQLKEILNN